MKRQLTAWIRRHKIDPVNETLKISKSAQWGSNLSLPIPGEYDKSGSGKQLPKIP